MKKLSVYLADKMHVKLPEKVSVKVMGEEGK